MTKQGFRIEKDSMGELQVPEDALYAAQTQRAVNNFPISGLRMPRAFINALGLIKAGAAHTNKSLGHVDEGVADAVTQAALAVAEGKFDAHFPVDVYQTGSGTSSNMNSNEVIAKIASDQSGLNVHPNDHVNYGQSSNDVIPTAIHVSACLQIKDQLLPALSHLQSVIEKKAAELDSVTKTGRTHLMDAMPVRFSQELGGWASQVKHAQARIKDSLGRLSELALGGTAVGTGINADPEFGSKVAAWLSSETGHNFSAAENYFESLSSQDAAVEMSGQLKAYAVSLMKIANDLRWMNSGPLAGLGEIALPSLQPGSSIMPGKVNPVIPEAATMVAAQIMGNDTAITVGGQAGNFQLNVMLPMVAYNLLQSIEIAANVSRALADSAIAGFTVNEQNISAALDKNPILVTALNDTIGYEKGAEVAKTAYKQDRSVLDVALELTDLSEEELKRLLNPADLTTGGIKK